MQKYLILLLSLFSVFVSAETGKGSFESYPFGIELGTTREADLNRMIKRRCSNLEIWMKEYMPNCAMKQLSFCSLRDLSIIPQADERIDSDIIYQIEVRFDHKDKFFPTYDGLFEILEKKYELIEKDFVNPKWKHGEKGAIFRGKNLYVLLEEKCLYDSLREEKPEKNDVVITYIASKYLMYVGNFPAIKNHKLFSIL